MHVKLIPFCSSSYCLKQVYMLRIWMEIYQIRNRCNTLGCSTSKDHGVLAITIYVHHTSCQVNPPLPPSCVYTHEDILTWKSIFYALLLYIENNGRNRTSHWERVLNASNRNAWKKPNTNIFVLNTGLEGQLHVLFFLTDTCTKAWEPSQHSKTQISEHSFIIVGWAGSHAPNCPAFSTHQQELDGQSMRISSDHIWEIISWSKYREVTQEVRVKYSFSIPTISRKLMDKIPIICQ